MTGSTGRPQGGKGALRPSAIDAAADRLVLRELPFVLPAQPAQRRLWAELGLTVPQVLAAVDRLALAGVVKVKSAGGQMTALRATTTASTIAAEPATNGEPTP